MKRHISIFAFLLCVFAAVGQAGTAAGAHERDRGFLTALHRNVNGEFENDGIDPALVNTPVTCDFTADLPSGQKVEDWLFYDDDPTTSHYAKPIKSLGSDNPLHVVVEDDSMYYLVAHFAWITYKVKYDADGGTGAPSEVTGNSYNSNFTVSSTVPTKSGYAFAGWKADSNSKTYSAGASVAGSELCKSEWHDDNQTVKMTAQWTANKYAVSTAVEPSGVGSVTGAGTYDFGTQVTLTATANSGWKFEKWQDGSTVNPRTVTVDAAAATYTARFSRLTVAKPKVTTSFTYDGTQKTCASAGSHYTVTGNTGTDAGTYTFKATLTDGYAWSDETTADYTVNWTIEPKRAAALTLSSDEFSYTGGEQGPQVTCVNCAEVSGSVKTGTQVGTYYVKAKPSKNYAWSDGLTDERNFAWRIVEGHFSATIAPGEGGTGGSTVNYSTSQNPLETQISLPTRKGYEIESWTASGYVGTAPTIIGTALTIPARTAGNFTMTPTWKASTYTITIRLKDGESYGEYEGPRNYQLPGALTFDAADLNQISVAVKGDDSIFQGYFTDSGVMVYDAQGRNVKGAKGEYWTADYPTGTYCHDGDLTLSASWGAPAEKYRITVNVDPAGVGSVEGDGIYEKGSNAVLRATPNAGSGYSFCCWTNSVTGLSTNANPWTFTVTADETYTAVFTGNVYTVMFVDVYGGNPAANVTVQVGRQWKSFFPPMTYAGHILTGWYTFFPYEIGNKIDGDADVTPPATTPPIYLYAKWEEVATYTIAYDGNGATSGTMTNETALCGIETTLTSNKYARTGYDFAGWTNTVKQSFADGATVTNLAAKGETATLFAVWTPHTYTVTFDKNDGEGDQMPDQPFTYDVEQSLSSNKYTNGKNTFAGWATTSSGEVAYADGAKVVNLTDENGATVRLFAKWEKPAYTNNALSVAADCDRERDDDGRQPLDLISESTDCVSFDVADKGGNNKAVRMMPTSELASYLKMEVQLSGSGTLKFHYRTSIPYKGNSSLKFVFNNDYVPDLECSTSVDDWTEYVRHYDAAEGTMARWSFEEKYMNNDYALIDNIRWIPDRDGPKYADDDTPVTEFSMADGKLVFAFNATNEVASTYHLLGTNDLVAPMPWPMVFETNKASGAILFDIPVKADEPKMFYRIRELK